MGNFNRWLLNTFSTFELLVLVVGVIVGLAVLGFLLVHRRFEAERRTANNEVGGIFLGLFAAVYGIILGFVIVVLFEDFKATEATVQAESSALAQLYRSADLFPTAARIRLGKDIANYSYVVRTSEWKLLGNGHESLAAHDLVGKIYADIEAFDPKTNAQNGFYQSSTSILNDFVTARRHRLAAANETLPSVFQILLVGGAVLLILFLFFFGMESFRVHLAMVVGVSALVAFSLLLGLTLAYPFSGGVAVSSDPFHQGVLGKIDRHTGLVHPGLCNDCVDDRAVFSRP